MNALRVALVLAVALLGVAFTFPAAGQTGIIVSGADAVFNTSVSLSQGLKDSIGGVQPRVVYQYANASELFGLTSLPAALQTVLGQLPPRVLFQYADASKRETLSYPTGLIGDTTPPRISGVACGAVSSGSFKVTWATDEYASTRVDYGGQPGIYTRNVRDSLYVVSHEAALTGLSGSTCYYRIRATDRSGNAYQSPEYRCAQTYRTYLPLVQRP